MRKETESLKQENKQLRKQNESLNKEINKLRNNANSQNNSASSNSTGNVEEKYKALLQEKEKTITKLKSKLDNNVSGSVNYDSSLDGEKLVAIRFISVDQKFNHTIISKTSTKFHDVESQLYAKYPDYADDDNFFMFNGSKINRWKTLEENGVNGYTIMLKKMED